jgi:hypothetical protein
MVNFAQARALLRLARLVDARSSADERGRREQRNAPPTRAGSDADKASSAENAAVSQLLRHSFLAELETVLEQIGALTGIDGATVLNRELALVAFGVILPVGAPTVVMEATDVEGVNLRPIDLSTRGTRHRAGATYAAEHAMSVVFVSAEGGQITCMHRHPSMQQVVLWRFGPNGA